MHWITKDWVLQDSLLDFIDLSGPHFGENLCNTFVKSCQEFGILKKALDATASSVKDLQIFELNENEWNTIEKIMSGLKYLIHVEYEDNKWKVGNIVLYILPKKQF
ncbi:hypothetical protein C1646_672315 [Rhizophagus diaphanus]|nr:hypothetical protein C1646_672315 [Rhizophagus diaphanus] [Rhizophagus sp. MUCL 43196]